MIETEKAGLKPVSLRTYKREFDKYNLSFHVPKKDKCTACNCFENTVEKSDADIAEHRVHLAEKDATYREHAHDQEQSAQGGLLCGSFDLEKVLNTPAGDSMLLYYSRKYSVYNLTVYESKTRKGLCNLWGESDAQRGAVEVGTCIWHWLCSLVPDDAEANSDPPISHVIMYCDCCGGQNRNRYMVAMLIHAIRTLPFETLELKFLLPGHTYMQVKQFHWTTFTLQFAFSAVFLLILFVLLHFTIVIVLKLLLMLHHNSSSSTALGRAAVLLFVIVTITV